MAQGGRFGPWSFIHNSVEEVDLTNDDLTSTRVRARAGARVAAAASSPSASSRTLSPSPLDDSGQRAIIIDDSDEDDAGVEVRNSTPLLLGDDEDLQELTAQEFADVTRRVGNTIPAGSLHRVITASGVEVRIGTTVELMLGDFLYVKFISHTEVSGILLKRTRFIDFMLPPKQNELCAVLQAEADIPDPDVGDCLVWRSIDEIITTREVVFTNHPFPVMSYREGARVFTDDNDIRDNGLLVCRWKQIKFSELRGRQTKVVEEVLAVLKKSECTVGYSVPHGVLRDMWRGISEPALRPIPGAIRTDRHTTGTHQATITDHFRAGKNLKRRKDDTIDLTQDEDDVHAAPPPPKRIRRDSVLHNTSIDHALYPTRRPLLILYSYGDICTGGGGTARAASETDGLYLKYLLDKDEGCCKTLKDNWPEVKVYKKDIYEFIEHSSRLQGVDVLHISFPCQYFSAAHTVPGKNDEANTATNTSTGDLLKKEKPRIATFEQTSGLHTHKRDEMYYERTINSITSMGYSIRARVITCDRLGNVQPRKRLFMIASCPGETLPPFPTFTHGTEPGLKRPVTINDRLRTLRNHRIEPHMRHAVAMPGRAYDGNVPLKHCLTTSRGPTELHPHGGRSFTLAERAVLAGFPPEHRFHRHLRATEITRQVGNAVPVCAMKAIFKECVKTMRETDRRIEEEKAEIVMID